MKATASQQEEFNPVTNDYAASREQLTKLLAPHAGKPLSHQQKLERIARELYDGDMKKAEAFERGAAAHEREIERTIPTGEKEENV